jgi:nucleotide-binding universal stress UspA family protein
MQDHRIIVPLDGSVLAECVLPHVVAIARVFDSNITLLRVITPSNKTDENQPIDPLSWEVKKAEAESYLKETRDRLQQVFESVEYQLLEGQPAEKIIEYTREQKVDLIALSSHGKSGLNEWNISSVVQKIILRSQKSILLIRAYNIMDIGLQDVKYERIATPLDCSQRAELIMPLASHISKHFDAQLLLLHINKEPEIACRTPPPEDDLDLVRKLTQRNNEYASEYFDQLSSQISRQGIRVTSRILTSKNVSDSLHGLIKEEDVGLVLLTAHGTTGSQKWSYGSLATSFIIYGSTPTIILQDLKPEDIEESQAELVAREYKGH